MPLLHCAKGFATLTSVLLAGSIASAVAVTLLLSGVSSTQNATSTTQSFQAIAVANACAEKALQTIHETLGFTGTGGLTLGEGSCAFTVTSGSESARTITVSGTVGVVTRKMKIEINALTPKITFSSWQEVADF